MSDAHSHSHAEHGHEAHADYAHAGHAHGAHTPSPAIAPAVHMRWSVLSLSVTQRVLLVLPMLTCLWLAVIWAIKS